VNGQTVPPDGLGQLNRFETQGLEQVDLALVLAVDVSHSVNEERFLLQKQGYAAAFRDPDVIYAVLHGGRHGRIAICMFYWSGKSFQEDVIGWRVLSTPEEVIVFADAIEATTRPAVQSNTIISGAIQHSINLFIDMDYDAARRVIDVSGDGMDNGEPSALRIARIRALKHNIVINGLPIEPTVGEDMPRQVSLNPSRYVAYHYETRVIAGEGSFMVEAKGYGDFARAVRDKLILEIAQQ
jgi:hypothetical protein